VGSAHRRQQTALALASHDDTERAGETSRRLGAWAG
jgi:hypothetical protein